MHLLLQDAVSYQDVVALTEDRKPQNPVQDNMENYRKLLSLGERCSPGLAPQAAARSQGPQCVWTRGVRGPQAAPSRGINDEAVFYESSGFGGRVYSVESGSPGDNSCPQEC